MDAGICEVIGIILPLFAHQLYKRLQPRWERKASERATVRSAIQAEKAAFFLEEGGGGGGGGRGGACRLGALLPGPARIVAAAVRAASELL